MLEGNAAVGREGKASIIVIPIVQETSFCCFSVVHSLSTRGLPMHMRFCASDEVFVCVCLCVCVYVCVCMCVCGVQEAENYARSIKSVTPSHSYLLICNPYSIYRNENTGEYTA